MTSATATTTASGTGTATVTGTGTATTTETGTGAGTATVTVTATTATETTSVASEGSTTGETTGSSGVTTGETTGDTTGDTTGNTGSCGDGVVDGGEACDDGNDDNTDACLDSCVEASCGDGFVWADIESCDDGNRQAGDGCDDTCTPTPGAMKVTTGYEFTCALFWDGKVKCWGYNLYGQLGYGNTVKIGDDETPDSVGFVDLGGPAVDIEAGERHVCALMADASIMCWGRNTNGQLGYGHTSNIGDDEAPVSAGSVDVGDDVVALALGVSSTCVLTDKQTLRCWGGNQKGQLGLGNTLPLSEEQPPSSLEPISLGGEVVDVSVGASHACALLVGGGVRCWGNGSFGALGLGNKDAIGDDELPSSAPLLSLGNTPIVDISSGYSHNCVLYDDGALRCWGTAGFGQLGGGNTERIGDNELPSSVPKIDVGGVVDELRTGNLNTCVRIGPKIKCWGQGSEGANGYGNTAHLGDDELPSSYGMVDVGFDVTGFATTSDGLHFCAQHGPELRCWGNGSQGQLGHGMTVAIGDNETPASAGNVPYF